MENKAALIKTIGNEIKLAVVHTDVIMTVYVLWLIITDTASWIPGALFGFTPFGVWELTRANKLFHLCVIHRLMIWHIFLVYCCCIFQAYYGFGCVLYPMRWVMFIIGLCLIIQLIIQRCNNE